MKVLIAKGYAEYVRHNEINTEDGSVWYLPQHHVYKKNDKLRIIHDCAAEFGGISLNKSCHQGPDINNLFLGVLLRFRLRRYALIGDIEAMFMQVKVPLALFLWFDKKNDLPSL